MKGNLQPSQSDTRLLATVITIIVLSFGALAWGWRSAHTAVPKSRPPAVWPSDMPAPQDNAAPASQATTASRNG